jgi:hypothetical protein
MVYKSSARGSRPVSLLAVHTAEGARTARALANYFWRDDIMASSHDAIDGKETIHMVPYHRASWTMRSGNPISDNVELCGFARWSRGQWLSTGVVDGVGNPRAMLVRLANWIRARAKARGIPTRKLTVTQLANNQWGVIAHDDWTKAKNDGTHWDPGPGFPWDVVMAMVNQPAEPEEEDVKPFQNLMLAREAKDKPGTSWPHVYVGDGIIRRHVASEEDLENLQYRIQQAGGNATVAEGWEPGTLAGVLGVLVKEDTP